MTTYNLNIANISFNSSLDSRDIQEEIDNIESLKNDYELNLEELNNELGELESDLYDIENRYRDWETDRKSTRLNSSHSAKSRMPSSA